MLANCKNIQCWLKWKDHLAYAKYYLDIRMGNSTLTELRRFEYIY